jgi:hypothetical protein
MKYYFLALGTLVAVCVGCSAMGDGQQILDNGEYYAPPAGMMQRPGPMVDGPGPGVMPALAPPPVRTFATNSTQVRFVGPMGMRIGWQIPEGYAENQLIAASRYNFPQGRTFRLKLTNISGRDNLVLYPTLQVYPAHPTTDAYLSHSSVPISLTDEDLDQMESNFVTKVIYLPDRRYQELAVAGVETLVSTRLDPGVDPVAEAERRGTIMVVLRIGNMDLEMPNAAVGSANRSAIPGQFQQVSYTSPDGAEGQHVPPVPIATAGAPMYGVPNPMIMGRPGAPGHPAVNPVSGVGGVPSWGNPMTATPIGLPGPPHLPYGGPAGLQSHTMRNMTKVDIGKPVDHMLIDVKHSPGIRLPKPVRHIKYSETHPSYRPGEVAYPAHALPQ